MSNDLAFQKRRTNKQVKFLLGWILVVTSEPIPTMWSRNAEEVALLFRSDSRRGRKHRGHQFFGLQRVARELHDDVDLRTQAQSGQI